MAPFSSFKTLVRTSLVAAFLVASSTPAASGDLVDRTSRAVWKIHGESSEAVGTAFAIGPREFITNAHVVRDLYEGERDGGIVYLSQGDRRIEFDWAERVSLTYNVAYFTTVERVRHYLPLATGFDARGNSSLHVVGYLGGLLFSVKQASPIVSEDGWQYVIPVHKISRNRVHVGLEGAPIVDSNGAVVAVVGGFAPFIDTVYGIRSEYARGLLEKGIGVRCLDLQCFRKIADKTHELSRMGNPVAQFQVGHGLWDSDRDRDLELLTRAAESGIFLASRYLCTLYRYERGLSDSSKAQYWCREAVTPRRMAEVQLQNVSYRPSKVMYAVKRSNVRTGPSTGHRRLGLLEVGERVRVTARHGTWFRLAPRAGQPKGFVSATLLSERKPGSESQAVAKRKGERSQTQALLEAPRLQRPSEKNIELHWAVAKGRVPGTAIHLPYYGAAWNYSNAQEAEDRAIQECHKYGPNCHYSSSGVNSCFVVGQYPNWFFHLPDGVTVQPYAVNSGSTIQEAIEGANGLFTPSRWGRFQPDLQVCVGGKQRVAGGEKRQ